MLCLGTYQTLSQVSFSHAHSASAYSMRCTFLVRCDTVSHSGLGSISPKADLQKASQSSTSTMDKKEKGFEGAEKPAPSQNELEQKLSDTELKRSKNHTVLSPQPSNDSKNPLVGSSTLVVDIFSSSIKRFRIELASV